VSSPTCNGIYDFSSTTTNCNLFHIITNALNNLTLSLRATKRSEVPPLAGLRRFAPRHDIPFDAFALDLPKGRVAKLFYLSLRGPVGDETISNSLVHISKGLLRFARNNDNLPFSTVP